MWSAKDWYSMVRHGRPWLTRVARAVFRAEVWGRGVSALLTSYRRYHRKGGRRCLPYSSPPTSGMLRGAERAHGHFKYIDWLFGRTFSTTLTSRPYYNYDVGRTWPALVDVFIWALTAVWIERIVQMGANPTAGSLYMAIP